MAARFRAISRWLLIEITAAISAPRAIIAVIQFGTDPHVSLISIAQIMNPNVASSAPSS